MTFPAPPGPARLQIGTMVHLGATGVGGAQCVPAVVTNANNPSGPYVSALVATSGTEASVHQPVTHGWSMGQWHRMEDCRS